MDQYKTNSMQLPIVLAKLGKWQLSTLEIIPHAPYTYSQAIFLYPFSVILAKCHFLVKSICEILCDLTCEVLPPPKSTYSSLYNEAKNVPGVGDPFFSSTTNFHANQ